METNETEVRELSGVMNNENARRVLAEGIQKMRRAIKGATVETIVAGWEEGGSRLLYRLSREHQLALAGRLLIIMEYHRSYNSVSAAFAVIKSAEKLDFLLGYCFADLSFGGTSRRLVDVEETLLEMGRAYNTRYIAMVHHHVLRVESLEMLGELYKDEARFLDGLVDAFELRGTLYAWDEFLLLRHFYEGSMTKDQFLRAARKEYRELINGEAA
jgi:hypothetical protein